MQLSQFSLDHRAYLSLIYNNRIIQLHYLHFLYGREANTHEQSRRLCVDSAVAIAQAIERIRATYMSAVSTAQGIACA